MCILPWIIGYLYLLKIDKFIVTCWEFPEFSDEFDEEDLGTDKHGESENLRNREPFLQKIYTLLYYTNSYHL